MFKYYPAFIQNNKEAGAIISDFSVTFPDLHGCSCTGITLEESLQQAKEVVKRHLEELSLKGKKNPEPTQNFDRLSKKSEYKNGIWFLVEIDMSKLNTTISEAPSSSTFLPKVESKKNRTIEDNRDHEILIRETEFLDLCPSAKKWKGTWKTNDARIGLSLKEDGVYVVPFPKGEWEYEGLSLFREHMEHSKKELELPFPCSIDEFQSFFKRAGLGAPCTQEKLEEFKLRYLKEYESDQDRVKRLKKRGLPDEEVAAHIKRRNPRISYHRLGKLLPGQNVGQSFKVREHPEQKEKERGRTLMKKVRKDERLAGIAGVFVKR